MEIMTGVPMTGHVVVFNNEIYYSGDLRRRLVADGQAQSTGRYSRPNQARTLPSGKFRHRIRRFEFREKRHLLANVPSFTSGAPACPYDAPPDTALAAARAHRGTGSR
jgi:hypothetical protein